MENRPNNESLARSGEALPVCNPLLHEDLKDSVITSFQLLHAPTHDNPDERQATASHIDALAIAP